MKKSTIALGIVVCLAVVAAGCGSSSMSSTDLTRSIIAAKMAEARAKAVEASADKIENYGSAAEGAEKAAVIDAMRSFLLALDARDYAKVCAGLLSTTRTGMERFGRLSHRGKGCPSIVATALTSTASTQAKGAAKAANGSVADVRVGQGQAYVIYRPAGGGPLSYITLKSENGEWKATGLGIGAPVRPPVPPLPLGQ